jgi:MOSC domain-containing protein YiiM
LSKVVSVNISEKKGLRKHEVDSAELRVGTGIMGDAHAGNWHRQISLLAEESVDTMRALGLSGLTPGAFAENINTVGIELKTLPVGTLLKVGNCLLAVTQIGKECHNDGCAIQKATGKCVMPTDGIFTVVVRGGTVQKGDDIEVLNEVPGVK